MAYIWSMINIRRTLLTSSAYLDTASNLLDRGVLCVI